MERILSEKYGCKVVQKNGRLFIRFDEGHFNIKFVDYEISSDEAELAMKSEQDAYQVCLLAQNRNKNNKVKTCNWFKKRK